MIFKVRAERVDQLVNQHIFHTSYALPLAFGKHIPLSRSLNSNGEKQTINILTKRDKCTKWGVGMCYKED